MKSYLLIMLFVLLTLTGCYDDSQSVSGHYYIKSDIPVTIYYTDGEENLQTVISDELNYYFEIKSKDVSNVFHHCVKWESEVEANVYMLVEFEDGEYTETDIMLNNKTEWGHCLQYCVPWNTECAKIRIKF